MPPRRHHDKLQGGDTRLQRESRGRGGEAYSEATSALRMSMRVFIGSGSRLQLHEVRMAALVAQGPAWGPA